MGTWPRIFTSLTLLLIFPLFLPSRILAQSEITVSFTVGETILTFSGQTSPQAVITLREAGAVVGTTTADEGGNFRKSLFAQSSGVHTVDIYATDSNGLTTPTITFSVSLVPLIETTVFNIILPPTISLSKSEITQGETLEVSGLTVPVSNTTLFIASSIITKTASSSADGVWLYGLDTSELELGDHQINAQTTTESGYQSQVSQTKSFQVLSATPLPPSSETPAPTTASISTSAPSPSPTSISGTPLLVPRPSPILILPGGLVFFDINKSGRLEVVEVAEAVRRWVNELREKPKEGSHCDLNGDGKCNLIDFSILLFWIGR